MIRWLITKLFSLFGIGYNDPNDVSPACVCKHRYDEHWDEDDVADTGSGRAACHHAGCDCTNYRPVFRGYAS